MELICRLLKQYPLQTRDYTDRRSTSGRLQGKNDQPQSFTSLQ